MNLQEEIRQKLENRSIANGALGDLEELAKQIALIQQTSTPELMQPKLLLFAADHGISNEKISCLSSTKDMVNKVLDGRSGINALIDSSDLSLHVIDCGVNGKLISSSKLIDAKIKGGSAHMMQASALSPDDISNCFDQAKRLFQSKEIKDSNCIGFGDIGVGNSAAGALILSTLYQLRLDECIGKGSGIDLETFKKKYTLLESILNSYQQLPTSPIAILSAFGGFEIGVMMASMLEAFMQNKLMIIDGFIPTVAFALAQKMEPRLKRNAIFSQLSDEKGHGILLEKLETKPILNLGLRQGEGVGVALAYPIIKSATRLLS